MRIYITGIAGFMGSHLATHFLSKGYKVGGCDNLIGGSIENIPENAEYDVIDILNYHALEKSMQDYDVVIHAAALAYEGLSVFSPNLVMRNIYAGTVSVATAAIKNKYKLFINCSSMARYGAQEPPFWEWMSTRPEDPYGLAKAQAEQALFILSDIHKIKVLNVVPHNIIGVNQKYDDAYRNVASIFLNLAVQHKPIFIYGDGEQKRSFSDYRDCIAAIDILLEKSEEFDNKETYNIGPQGNEITITELANLIKDICNSNSEIKYIPGRPREVKNAWCSSKKAIDRLGYNPKTNIATTLTEMRDQILIRGPKLFSYHLPVEIITEATPKTWTDKLFNG